MPLPRAPRVSVSTAGFVGRRMLVVENDPAMRVALSLLLRSWGMEVAEASGVGEALTAVREGTVPDIVLTDYRLDEQETGVHAIEALREDLGEPLPAVIVSAEGGDAIRRLADPLGRAGPRASRSPRPSSGGCCTGCSRMRRESGGRACAPG